VAVEGAPTRLPPIITPIFPGAGRRGKVALLAQSPYLRLALSPEIMRGQWATRLLEPAALSAELAADQTRMCFVWRAIICNPATRGNCSGAI